MPKTVDTTLASNPTPLPTLTKDEFDASMKGNEMASEKLEDGVQRFANDTLKLEELIKEKLTLWLGVGRYSH